MAPPSRRSLAHYEFSPPLSRQDELLLQHFDVDHLPGHFPIVQLVLPIALLNARAGTKRDATGRLAREVCERYHIFPLADGTHALAIIKGDPQLGLPRGQDPEVAFAVTALVLARRRNGGTGADLSLRDVLNVLGYADDTGGKKYERVRVALDRYAKVTIELIQVPFGVNHDELLSAVTGGEDAIATVVRLARAVGRDATPGPPRLPLPRERTTAVTRREHRGPTSVPGIVREVTGIFKHGTYTPIDAHDGRGVYLRNVNLDDSWVEQVDTGRIGWLDLALYLDLPTPLSQALYRLAVGEAFVDQQGRVEWSLDYIRSAVGAQSGMKANQFLTAVRGAMAELRDRNVVADFGDVVIGRGKYRVWYKPGAPLEVSRLLSGVTPLDPHDHRAKMLLLNHFGIYGEDARSLVTHNPLQVHRALLFVIYEEQTRGTRDETVKPIGHAGKWITKAVTEIWDFSSYRGFREWVNRREAALEAKAAGAVAPPPQTLFLAPPMSSETARAVTGPEIGAGPDAARARETFARVLDRATTLTPITKHTVATMFAAWGFDGDTLIVVGEPGESDFYRNRMAEATVSAELGALVAEETGGHCVRMSAVRFDPVTHGPQADDTRTADGAP